MPSTPTTSMSSSPQQDRRKENPTMNKWLSEAKQNEAIVVKAKAEEQGLPVEKVVENLSYPRRCSLLEEVAHLEQDSKEDVKVSEETETDLSEQSDDASASTEQARKRRPRRCGTMDRASTVLPSAESRRRSIDRSDFRSTWIQDRGQNALRMDAWTAMYSVIHSTEFAVDDMLSFPKWPNGRPKMLRAATMERLVKRPDERASLSELPMNDVTAVQGDVNHLNLHQLLYLRMQEADFKSTSSNHDAHMAFLAKVEKSTIAKATDWAYTKAAASDDDIQMPKEKTGVSEAILLCFGASNNFVWKVGQEASPWWASVVGPGLVMFINVKTLEITFKHPGQRINVYRDYSKQGVGGMKNYTIQIIELPENIAIEDVNALLEADQDSAKKLIEELRNSSLYKKGEQNQLAELAFESGPDSTIRVSTNLDQITEEESSESDPAEESIIDAEESIVHAEESFAAESIVNAEDGIVNPEESFIAEESFVQEESIVESDPDSTRETEESFESDPDSTN